MKRVVLTCFLIFFFSFILIGCFGDSEQEEDVVDVLDPIYEEDEQVSIRVLTTDGLLDFMSLFGDDIKEQFEHIDLTVHVLNMFDPEKGVKQQFEEYFEEKNIDIIFSPWYFENWAEEGKFVALDVYLDDRDFEAEKIHPNVLELLRAEDGNIYGLAPMFSSQAIFYNKDIFDQYGVEYPHDHMSWDDILTLAEQFPAEEVAGLYEMIPYLLIANMANSKHISLFNDQGTQVNITGNNEFRELIENVTDAIKRGNVSASIEEDTFLQGQAAMTVKYHTYIESIQNSGTGFAWDVAIEPRDPSRANQSSSLGPMHTMAIYAGSKHADHAWEIIRYLNSEAYTLKLIEEDPSLLVSRYSHIRNTTDKNMSAFYALSDINRHSYIHSPILRKFELEFSGLMPLMTLPKLVDESITIDEWLQDLQEQTQKIVDELLEGVEIQLDSDAGSDVEGKENELSSDAELKQQGANEDQNLLAEDGKPIQWNINY